MLKKYPCPNPGCDAEYGSLFELGKKFIKEEGKHRYFCPICDTKVV